MPMRRSCDRIRCRPAALVRRPGGARAGAAVPGERHPGPQHPAGTARRRSAALSALRRGIADQRHQPRADRTVARRTGPARPPTPGLLRQPQLGALRRRRGEPDARRRNPARRGVHHVRVGRLLELHPVRRGHRRGPRGGRPAVTRTRQAPPILRPPAAHRHVRRRYPGRGGDSARAAQGRRAAGVHRALGPAGRRRASRPAAV